MSWYLDSGCSRHMTSKRSIFQDLQMKKGRKEIFGGNHHGKVMVVEGLQHNLLSISQLCDSGNRVVFNRDQCIVNNKNVTWIF